MKRFLSFLLIISIISVVCLSGCVRKLSPDRELHAYIVDYASEHDEIALEGVDGEWDYAVIDSAYHIEYALAELGVTNAGAIPTKHDDVLFLILVSGEKIISYAEFSGADGAVYSILGNYVYPSTGEVCSRTATLVK